MTEKEKKELDKAIQDLKEAIDEREIGDALQSK